jgi:hypothetical protein
MTPDEAVVEVITALGVAGLPYMLVGSLASNFHGIPRSTRDADVVIELPPDGLSRLARALPEDLTLQPQGAFEAVTGTTRYVIDLAGSPFVCELFVLSDDPHDRERFARRQRVRLLGRFAFVATAEDTIVTKLRWSLDAGRSKDRDDIRNIIAVRHADLDWAYIERWAAAHATDALLAEIRRSIPEGSSPG